MCYDIKSLGLHSPLDSLVVTQPIFIIETKTYQSIGNVGAETVPPVAIKHTHYKP